MTGFNDDGTLKGIYFSAACGKRGDALVIGIDRKNRMLTLVERDFPSRYTEAALMAYPDIQPEEIAQTMKKFMRRYNLKIKKICYKQIYRKETVK